MTWHLTPQFIDSILASYRSIKTKYVEMFYLNSTLNFGIPPVLVFHLEVYYKVDRLLTGLTAQQKGTTARWYSNKTSLPIEISPHAQSREIDIKTP